MPAINSVLQAPVGEHSKFTLGVGLTAIGDKAAAQISGYIDTFSIYVEFSSGAAAGTIELETADDVNYTGTWAHQATISWVAGSSQQVASFSHIALGAIRARVTGTVTSGTAKITMVTSE